jgi:hypothetical protein
MGRKSRRKAKLRAAARLAQRVPNQPVYQAKPIAESKAVAASVKPTGLPAQANRYQYVIPEMVRIGIIAGILFVILFVLAFILH